jgi:quinol monooxygenase YgiN
MKRVSKIILMMGLLLSQFSFASVFLNTATVLLKAGQEGRYFAAAKQFDIINLTRKEPGNYVYKLHVDRYNPRVVVFNEVWKSKADLDAHLQTAHMTAFFKSINFDPSLYVITVKDNTVTFTPKPGFYNYVIQVLKLEGLEK